MTGPNEGAAVHVGGQRWQVAPGDEDGLVERLTSAAEQGEVLSIRILDDAAAEGVLVVAPAVVPVVVTGVQPRPPAEGHPQY